MTVNEKEKVGDRAGVRAAVAITVRSIIMDTRFITLIVIVLGVIFVPILVIGKMIAKKARFNCQYCVNLVKPFRELPQDTKDAITKYFKTHEHRTPDYDGIFVCENCRVVFDDFSGEKLSRDPDPYLGNITFCKICDGRITHCDPDNDVVTCPKCQTTYKWQKDSKTGLMFFSPQNAAEISRRAPNYLDSF